MSISTKNQLIHAMLKKEICSRNLFETFCLYANGLLPFEAVEDVCKDEAIDFNQLCLNQGLNPEEIRP